MKKKRWVLGEGKIYLNPYGNDTVSLHSEWSVWAMKLKCRKEVNGKQVRLVAEEL